MSSGIATVMDGSPSSAVTIQSGRELIIFGQGIGSTVDLAVSTSDIRTCATGLRVLASTVRSAMQPIRIAAFVTSATAHLTADGPAITTADRGSCSA